MLYYISYLYRKCLLVGVYKHLIYRFYLARQFVPWIFAKLQKQNLGLLKPLGQRHKKKSFKLMETSRNNKGFQIQLELSQDQIYSMPTLESRAYIFFSLHISILSNSNLYDFLSSFE